MSTERAKQKTTRYAGGKQKGYTKKTNSLAHTTWMCKYHIVFTPKYRRKAIYGQYRESIREILRTLCKYKGVEILEGHMMLDHVHLLVSIPPKLSVSSFMGYLKGKSALMVFDQHANLKYKYGNRHFWAEGYYDRYILGKLIFTPLVNTVEPQCTQQFCAVHPRT